MMAFSFIMIAGIETCTCVAVFQKFISRGGKADIFVCLTFHNLKYIYLLTYIIMILLFTCSAVSCGLSSYGKMN
jgi:hypothetical protein